MLPERTREIVRMLSLSVDAKGDYFPGHSEGVAYLVSLMGRAGRFDTTHIYALQVAALMHDVGKLHVPDDILGAPRPLTSDEWVFMRAHAVAGEVIASGIHGTAGVAKWIRHHHERFDGGGYPDGLAGEAIPLEARMLHVADAFHVITSDRPYAIARTRSQAVEEMYAFEGTQFDPIALAMLADQVENGARLDPDWEPLTGM